EPLRELSLHPQRRASHQTGHSSSSVSGASSLATVFVERSMHPDWLSNAYLIGDKEGGTAVFVDSGAPLRPLFDAVSTHGLRVTHLLTTHADGDHIAGDDAIRGRYDCK